MLIMLEALGDDMFFIWDECNLLLSWVVEEVVDVHGVWVAELTNLGLQFLDDLLVDQLLLLDFKCSGLRGSNLAMNEAILDRLWLAV